MQTLEGALDASGRRFAIVASRWNGFFMEALIAGAKDRLVRLGASEDQIVLVRCPGSFELAATAARIVECMQVDAVICLGVLIRGATPHFDLIASDATRGIGAVGLGGPVPVTFGVITCDTLEQAIERSGSKAGNKGAEAAEAAVEMVTLYDAIEEAASRDS